MPSSGLGRQPAFACHPPLNHADAGTSSDNTDAAAALADHPQLELLDTLIRRRKAFANAVGLGLAVDELTPRDPKACEELAQLARNVFNIADTSTSNGN